jgi:heme exporter protein D
MPPTVRLDDTRGDRVNEFFAMGGYAFYVWGSYGVTAAVIIAEIFVVARHRKQALEEARLSGPEEAPGPATTARGTA